MQRYAIKDAFISVNLRCLFFLLLWHCVGQRNPNSHNSTLYIRYVLIVLSQAAFSLLVLTLHLSAICECRISQFKNKCIVVYAYINITQLKGEAYPG